jgi:succinoglycan biosynthesis protein ExoW
MANALLRELKALLGHNMASPAAPSPIRHASDSLGKEDPVTRPLGGVWSYTPGAPPAAQAPIAEVPQIHSTQKAFGLPPTLAIIVPYYQRKAGILRRCLACILSQKVNPTIGIHVIIVDDGSPWPATEELRNIQIPEHMKVDVVTRNNGGPAAARNSGLDHVFCETDYIAFVDSDDTWRDDHIQRAINALGSSSDLYVSDHLQWAGPSNLGTREFGGFIKTKQSSTSLPLATIEGVFVISNADIIPYAIKEFIAHTSSIVYRREKFMTCRFDERQWYGEDDIFLLDLLFSSTQTCVSTEIEVELGFGENIFFGSWSWDSENNLKRCYYQFITYKKIRRRYQLGPELHETVTRIIRSWRPALTFFIMRRLLKGRAVPFSLLLSLLREDPVFFASLPLNVLRAALEWTFGRIRGEPAFTRF